MKPNRPGLAPASVLGISRPWLVCAATVAACMAATRAEAQLDPLLFLQRSKPNVLIAVDVSNRMQRDAGEAYYDPYTYTRAGDAWETAIGVTAESSTSRYRRKYIALQHMEAWGNDRFSASSIEGVGDRTDGYATFFAPTRLAVARSALAEAVVRNARVARFGLIKMRQANARIVSEKNEGPVWVADGAQQTPTETGTDRRWMITRPVVDSSNGAITGTADPLVRADAATANADVSAWLGKGVEQPGALLPAGRDAHSEVDAPVFRLLEDARAEAARLIAADTQCRNTVVILVTGGGEGTTADGNPATTASSFLSVSGHRVPIYVVAIAPTPGSADQLRAVARNSGGAYFEISGAAIEAQPAGSTVPDALRAANAAIQHAFAAQADVDAAPTDALPSGPLTEWPTTGPVVGTVRLDDAMDSRGRLLPNTRISTPTGTLIPQRGNLLVTAGLTLPGFEGRLRGFRMYRPEPDASKPYGWAFVADGTPLWVASAPPADARNIFTTLPDGRMMAFTTANAAFLAPHLNAADATALIVVIRGQPMGAVVGSTPAVLDPPSLDPPPDSEYPAFAQQLAERRSFVFVGANDGMLHAIDARTGKEAWAFIPFNLLPKLKRLLDGQAVGSFTYFVDSSPKVADVKAGGRWRTYLTIGEGPGGTFYQTLDVTMDALPASVSPTDDGVAALLTFFSQPTRIPLVWSFPSYASFDATIAPFGDLKPTALPIEKTVGQTWSDPAVGQVERADSPHVALVGSGFLPRSQQQRVNRGGIVAGTTFYLLRMDDGTVLDSRDVGSDGIAEDIDHCAVANDCRRSKNALQADPVATGPADSRYISKAYVGDLDGRVWRFNLTLSGDTPRFSGSPAQLFDATNTHPVFASMASVNVGGSQDYLFFASGSDLLPSNGLSQAYKLFGVLDAGGFGVKKFEVPLESVDGASGDEKASAFPAVAGDIVFFTTSTYRPATPCAATGSNLYAVTFVGGAAYDSTGDGRLTSRDTPKVFTTSNGRATAPFVADQHLVFTSGEQIQLVGDPRDYNNGVGQMGVRILSWRERR